MEPITNNLVPWIWTISPVACGFRTGYDEDVPIVVRFDSGFFDQQLFGFLEESNVGYVAVGKAYKDLKDYVEQLSEEVFEALGNDDGAWEVSKLVIVGAPESGSDG